jgi:hypothetical protein
MRRLNVKQANTRRERIARRVDRLKVKQMIKANFEKQVTTPEESNGTINS